jgi:hypothetical protein
MTRARSSANKPPRLDNAPLDYAPEEELGVVYLFSHLARKRFGMRVEKVRRAFPDCIAVKQGREVTIEFEFRSSNYARHGHPTDRRKAADYIVCWEHDWSRKPRHIEVIELRKEFGLGFNVWLLPTSPRFAGGLPRGRTRGEWSVPPRCSEDDLLLVYRSQKEKAITDIFRVAGPIRYYEDAGWRDPPFKTNEDWMADIQRVARMKAPVHLSHLTNHRIFKNAGFVRGRMIGRPRLSEYWAELHDLIVRLNPPLRQKLRKYGPDRLG